MSRYLLDTHILLWWAEGNSRLSGHIRSLIEDGANEAFMSVVSVWEATIKAVQGRLELPREPLSFFQLLAERGRFTVLPIHMSHAALVFTLPRVHGDPFDRLLICQSRSEQMPLVSDDEIFQKYDLPGLIF